MTTKSLEVTGYITNLSLVFISIIKVVYKAWKGSIDDIGVTLTDIIDQLLNAGAHLLYAAIIHDDHSSWICATIGFVLFIIYLLVYLIYAPSDQRKIFDARLVSVIVIAILSMVIAVILNISPFLQKHISRKEVNAILYVVITSICSLYLQISLLFKAFCDGKLVPSVMQIVQIIFQIFVPSVMQIVQTFFQISSYILLFIYASIKKDPYNKITNIVGICSCVNIALISFIFFCYNLCQTAQATDIERGEISERTPPSSLPQTQPEPDTRLQNIGIATGSVDDLMSGTNVVCRRTSYETQNKSAPDMKHHEFGPSASARASPLPPLPHSPTTEEGTVPTSVYSTLSSMPNVESETPTNRQDQILATPTGFADYHNSTNAAISSSASSETQKESASDMDRHKLEPSASAVASPLSPFPHSPTKDEDATPTFVDPPLSSIPNVKNEIPNDMWTEMEKEQVMKMLPDIESIPIQIAAGEGAVGMAA